MIDYHSHFLPGVDDGSKTVDMTKQMLQISYAQGVKEMVATPHFYAHRDRVSSFLEKRTEAMHGLQDMLRDAGENFPSVRCGAEVAFFYGISRAEEMDSLLIEGTDLFLLEMPFRTWTKSDLKEVEDLIYKRRFRVIIAHLERYIKERKNRKWIEELLDLPVIVQINADSLLHFRTRGRCLKLFEEGKAHLLSSDCHGIETRPPNLAQGYRELEKRFGKTFIEKKKEYARNLIKNTGGEENDE